MNRRLTFHPRAAADLADVWDYTASRWSEAKAVRYLTGLQAMLDLLRLHPEIARLREEFSPPVKLHHSGSHLVILVATAAELQVIRVGHGRSNWKALIVE